MDYKTIGEIGKYFGVPLGLTGGGTLTGYAFAKADQPELALAVPVLAG